MVTFDLRIFNAMASHPKVVPYIRQRLGSLACEGSSVLVGTEGCVLSTGQLAEISSGLPENKFLFPRPLPVDNTKITCARQNTQT